MNKYPSKPNIYKMILVLLFAVLIFSAVLMTIIDARVAYIGRYTVTKPEFYLYLYEQKLIFEEYGEADIWEMNFDSETGENVAKQNALNSIAYVRLALDYADRQNITLSPQVKQQAKDNAEEIYASLESALGARKLEGLGIDKKLCERVSEEGVIFNEVYTAITRNFELSEADFESFYWEFYSSNRSYILADTQELKDSVRERYIIMKKDEIFKNEYEKWFKDTQIQKNDKIWNKISISDFLP